ncbi:hypothetical protein B0F90DRAFT_1632413, partial [Multifurca ochricompacta]
TLLVLGWNVGSTGPLLLLPTIQSHYQQMLFLFVYKPLINPCHVAGTTVLGISFSRHLLIACITPLCQVAVYSMQAPAGPFPIMLAAYLVASFGMGLQNAGANAFVGGFNEDVAFYLCLCHGSAHFVPPSFSATHFANARHWSFHYLISLGVSLLNTAMLSTVFRFRTQCEIMAGAGYEVEKQILSNRAILRLSIVNRLALFALIYVALEVILGNGWIVTFIIHERQGGPSAGYISFGIFGGLTVGRIALICLNHKIGGQRALFIYAILCIAHATTVLPKWLLAGAIGIAAIGQAGSAVLPLLTGILASKFGISSLQPL